MGRTFGAYLRGIRRSKGVSQQVLSDLVDYKRTNMSAIENGKQKPSNDLLLRIAEVLGESYEMLVAVKIVDGLNEGEEEALWRLLCERHLQQEEPFRD